MHFTDCLIRFALSPVGSDRACYRKGGQDAIRQYLDGERFDPETTRFLGIAFEFAIQALHNWGEYDPPREAIARAIIGYAKAGERDPERLCDLALEACFKPIISAPSPPPPHGGPPARPDS